MKCFISDKDTNNKTRNIPVHRDHRDEFKAYLEKHGHPKYSNYVNMQKIMDAVEASKDAEEIVVTSDNVGEKLLESAEQALDHTKEESVEG